MPLSEIIVCPVCRSELERERCTGCGREYRRSADVLDTTPLPPPDPDVKERWSLWEALQANGERAYESWPSGNLAVGERDDVRAFAEFCRLRGRVLDVGCGPQEMPSYAAGFDGELVGIDPLLGAQPRRFEFVRGIAEYLPFRDASFDQVLFATSIDHVLSPALSVASAARVTKPGGAVVVWLGEVPSPPSRRKRLAELGRLVKNRHLRAAAMRIRDALTTRRKTRLLVPDRGAMDFDIPKQAADAFHFDHPSRASVIEWLTDAGLEIEEIDDGKIERSCFIRARRPAASSHANVG